MSKVFVSFLGTGNYTPCCYQRENFKSRETLFVQDALIDPTGLDQFTKNTAGAKLIDFDNSRHEIYNSDDGVIAAYYDTIFSFLES